MTALLATGVRRAGNSARRLPGRPAAAVLATAAGVALFALALHAVDASAVLSGMRRLGQGFVLILMMGSARLAMRAAAWSVCAGGTRRLPFGAAFGACLVGEAAGNLTPLGLAASEPAKVLWVREHAGMLEAAASLAVETLLYSLTVAAMILAGTFAWAAIAAPPGATFWLAVGVAVSAGTAWLVASRSRRTDTRRGVFQWLDLKGQTRPRVRAVTQGLRRSAEILGGLVRKRPAALVSVSLLEMAFHAASIAEVWLTLVLLGVPGAGLQHAFLLDYANRVVTVAFKFVPLRLGVDELASASMASLLGTAGAAGVTLAVIRKTRVLVLSAAGLATGAAAARRRQTC